MWLTSHTGQCLSTAVTSAVLVSILQKSYKKDCKYVCNKESLSPSAWADQRSRQGDIIVITG